jgi:hypothetical protein
MFADQDQKQHYVSGHSSATALLKEEQSILHIPKLLFVLLFAGTVKSGVNSSDYKTCEIPMKRNHLG